MDPIVKWLLGIFAALIVFVGTSGIRTANNANVQAAHLVTKLDALVAVVHEIREDGKVESREISAALKTIERALITDKAELMEKITAVQRRVDAIDQWVIRNNDNHTAVQQEVRQMRSDLSKYRERLVNISAKPDDGGGG